MARLDRRSRDLVIWRISDLQLTHKQVAGFLGVSPGQFSKQLSGDRNVSESQLKQLALALGITDRLLVTHEVAA